MKYLPGIKLGKNVVADPDLENAGISFLLFANQSPTLELLVYCSDGGTMQ